MRWLLNGILALAGIPLLGTTLGLLVSFAPPATDDFKEPERVLLIGSWLLFLALFACAYASRTGWLERTGIYQSWSNFEAYMKENHGYPPVSDREKTEFLSWAGLTEKRPAQFRRVMKAVYGRIHVEIDAQERRKSYIKCLAWYAEGWPMRDDCYDLCEDDPVSGWP